MQMPKGYKPTNKGLTIEVKLTETKEFEAMIKLFAEVIKLLPTELGDEYAYKLVQIYDKEK